MSIQIKVPAFGAFEKKTMQVMIEGRPFALTVTRHSVSLSASMLFHLRPTEIRAVILRAVLLLCSEERSELVLEDLLPAKAPAMGPSTGANLRTIFEILESFVHSASNDLGLSTVCALKVRHGDVYDLRCSVPWIDRMETEARKDQEISVAA